MLSHANISEIQTGLRTFFLPDFEMAMRMKSAEWICVTSSVISFYHELSSLPAVSTILIIMINCSSVSAVRKCSVCFFSLFEQDSAVS